MRIVTWNVVRLRCPHWTAKPAEQLVRAQNGIKTLLQYHPSVLCSSARLRRLECLRPPCNRFTD